MEALSSFFTSSVRISYSPSEKVLLTRMDLNNWDQGYMSLLPVKRSYYPVPCRSRFLMKKANAFQKKLGWVGVSGASLKTYDKKGAWRTYMMLWPSVLFLLLLQHQIQMLNFRVQKRLEITSELPPKLSVCQCYCNWHIVGLAGPPGAGKTTLASEVARRVNGLWPQRSRSVSIDSQVDPLEVAIVLPMDGFHLYRHQLDAMEDPEEAHARRGAPWTFNPELLLKCLKTLKSQGSVYAPSFDHGVGDPVEDDIFVDVRHKVVIVEGNYLFLEEGLWKEISSEFDEKWFIDVDIEKAMQRVLKRHISTGKLPEVAKWRIDYNDQPNAELIMRSKKNADLVIKSADISS